MRENSLVGAKDYQHGIVELYDEIVSRQVCELIYSKIWI